MFPNELTVFIEGLDNERKAKKLRTIPWADGEPIAEYETEDGDIFGIELSYIAECAEQHKPPHIPLAVIRKNKEIREKLEFGRNTLSRQAKQQQTGLILPDGFKV